MVQPCYELDHVSTTSSIFTRSHTQKAMKHILLLISILCSLQVAWSQDKIQMLEQSIEETTNKLDKTNLLVQLGVAKRAERPRSAIRSFEDAIDLATSIKYEKGLVEAYLEIAIAYVAINRNVKAIESLEAGFQIARRVSGSGDQMNYMKLLTQVHGRDRNYTEMKKYQQMFINMQDSLRDMEAQEEIAAIEEELQVEKEIRVQSTKERQEALDALERQEAISLRKELEITRLESARALEEQKRMEQETEAMRTQIELTEKIQRRNRLIFAFGILLLFAGGIVQWFRYKQQKKLAEFEKQKADRLERIDKLKDQFLANTSHELRTPLNGIIGLAEALYDGVDHYSKEEQQENLSMVIASGKRLSNLVNDLLDFSKMRNDELSLALKPVDLYALSDVVLQINHAMAHAKHNKLVNAVPKDLPAAEADENRLQQIMHNLIDNAIKFTSTGVITVSALANEDHIEVSVADTGIGIPADHLQEIFDEFQQVDGTESRMYSGTGLGLSITRKLVELHGGRIGVDSVEGKGSTFTFSLPISSQKAIPVSQERLVSRPVLYPVNGNSGSLVEDRTIPPTEGAADKITILIVDDEPVNQKVLQNHLAGATYHILSAMNGEEAMEIIDSGQHIDLVLLDIMMPRMSGYTVCQKIRNRYLASQLPVIMITAKNQVSDLVEALSYGANDYLAKPFSKDEFLARIKTHLDLYHINYATSRFVPNEFLRMLGYDTITDVKLGDFREREVTVFFSDIRSYTSLSESMTPEENFKFVVAYVKRMGPIIRDHGGFVLQYMGDGIMALFLEDPMQAIQAAIAMQEEIRNYNASRKEASRREIEVCMGMHTGQLVMGIIGDESRNDPATISDAVNIASRMEGLSKFFESKLLITEESLEKVSSNEQISTRFLGKVKAKGKKESVRVYEVLDAEHSHHRKLKQKTRESFSAGMESYYKKEFEMAAGYFTRVLKENPHDEAAKHYLKKSTARLHSEISEGWDGAERIHTE